MSSYIKKEATRESYALVPETCPRIDKALAALEDEIKDRTGSLRDALTDTLDRAITAETRIEELETKVSDLEYENRNLRVDLGMVARSAS